MCAVTVLVVVVVVLLCAQCECFALEHNDFVAFIH